MSIGSNLQEFAAQRIVSDMDSVDITEVSTYIRKMLNTIDSKLAEEMISLYISEDTLPARQLHTMVWSHAFCGHFI